MCEVDTTDILLDVVVVCEIETHTVEQKRGHCEYLHKKQQPQATLQQNKTELSLNKKGVRGLGLLLLLLALPAAM